MNFLKAFVVLAVMATLLTMGSVLMAQGSPWLFWISFAALVVGFGKIGCASH